MKDIHLISDSTGETLNAMLRAGLAPFDGADAEIHASVFVRSAADLEAAIVRLRRRPGFVCYTLMDGTLRTRLDEVCRELGVPALAALDPLLARLAEYLGRQPGHGVGRQHQLDSEYFQRIAALDFALANDDGARGSRFARAEVILTGVSRTSKTPTCIYLAHRGIKAANMPLVPGRPPDPAFIAAMEAGTPVIGLTASPTRLAQIRGQRLEALGDRTPDYADPARIREEVAEARLFFERHGLPVIDVTRRSIEETAAAVLAHLDRIREGAS